MIICANFHMLLKKINERYNANIFAFESTFKIKNINFDWRK